MIPPKKICVVGLGYVGLTLAVVLAEKGFHVYGSAHRKELADQLNRGIPHFHEKGLEILLKKYLNKNLFISPAIPENVEMDVFIITVGTPLDKTTKKANVRHIEEAVQDVGKRLRSGNLVVLRSTVQVGVTRDFVLPLLRKYQPGEFFLAFCPERTIEGKALAELKYLPQIVGGLNEESVNRASEIFMKVTRTIVRVSSLEAAEMIKLIDNSYRDLTFAFANEIAMMSKHLSLDAVELIQAANFGYSRTNVPVPGFVGGACLEKDPHILVDSSRTKGYVPRLVAYARELNESLPGHVLQLLERHCSSTGKTLANAKIFISGIAFKGRPETDDLRGSPTMDFLRLLQKAGVQHIFAHDFVVKREVLSGLGVTPCTFEEGFRDADAFFLMNNHEGYENLDIEHFLPLMKHPALFFDGWHFFDPELIKAHTHITYEGLGTK